LLQYIGAPSPYLIGILSSQVGIVNKLRELGDICFIDIANRAVRLSHGSAPLIPFGYPQTSASQGVGLNSSSKSVADDDRPWADVCTPYARCINTAFKTGNVNELRASVYACFICLLLKDNRGIFMVEDPQLRSFLDQFRRTLIYQALTTTPDTQQQQQNITDPEFIAIQQRVMYGVSRGGFSDVRQVLIAFAFDLTAPTF